MGEAKLSKREMFYTLFISVNALILSEVIKLDLTVGGTDSHAKAILTKSERGNIMKLLILETECFRAVSHIINLHNIGVGAS